MTDHIIFNQESKAAPIKAINQLSPNKRWIISIKLHRKKKTLSQGGLYWQWVTIIGDELGNFKDDMHEILKEDHLPPKIVLFNGEEREIRSIKNLSTKEMSDYMDRVNIWAGSEMGIYLPHPEDMQRNG